MHLYAKKIHLVLTRIVSADVKKGNTKGWEFRGERFHPSCYEVKFRVPLGFSYVDVEKQQDALYATCGCPVELIDLAGAVVIRVLFKELPTMLKFRPVMLEGLQPFELIMGYNALGERITHNWDVPHMINAGSTGYGKTDWIRLAAYCALRSGKVEIDFVDMKAISYLPFKGIPGVQIATDFDQSYELLESASKEVERRHKLIERVGNRKLKESYTPRFIIVDEAAELSPKIYTDKEDRNAARDMERFISTVARLGRETRNHLIYTTQYPTKELVSNQIKINCDARFCFSVAEATESEVILGRGGAEKLRVPGRAIFKGKTFHTLQVPYVGDDDVWSGLLAQFKSEVIYDGKSTRSQTQRKYAQGTFTEPVGDNSATSKTNSQRDTTREESILLPMSSRERWMDKVDMVSASKTLVINSKRQETVSCNVSTDGDSSLIEDW